MDFKQAEDRFKQLKAQFVAGSLSETEFKSQLEELMIQDELGDWWMIGHETERWHRHDGTNWVQADPPDRLPQISTSVVPATAQTTTTPASRRSFFSLTVVAILICLTLSISGYYMLNNIRQESIQESTSTEENTPPIADIPSTRASQTPRPTTQASQTPRPTSTSLAEFQVFIAVNKATLYKGPGLEYGLADQNPYQRGENFIVKARNASALWLLCSASNGSEGWLYIDWVDFDFDPSIISVAESIPPLPSTPTRKSRESDPEPSCVFNC
jgi:hypothetical protein